MSQAEIIQSVVLRDCGRQIERLAPHVEGHLARAAQRLSNPGGVAIVTGFGVPTASGLRSETDGPLGSAALARYFAETGRRSIVVSDPLNAKVISAALAAYDLPSGTLQVVDDQAGVTRVSSNLEDSGIASLVFVERLGPNRNGRYLSMSAVDLTDEMVPLEQLTSGPFYSVGVGDGGNEIGMGCIPADAVAGTIKFGADIHCVVATDTLVIAGVSNWGAWALLAALAVEDRSSADAAASALSISRFEASLDAILIAGAVDGVTKQCEPSVDGMDISIHMAVLTTLRVLAGVD